MTRIVKEYDERYAEFLDVAQELFYSKGYEQTSVKEIIDTVGVAKGTFYHYFDSKAELLEALVEVLVERLYEQALATVEPVLADETMDGAEKFERLFRDIGDWKIANRDFVFEAVRIFYQDENVLLRAKMMEAGQKRLAPLFAEIIRQGVEEGTFDVPYPEETARLVIMMNQALSESFARLMLAGERGEDAVSHLERKLVTFERSIERMLGAPENSLHLIKRKHIEVWLSEQ